MMFYGTKSHTTNYLGETESYFMEKMFVGFPSRVLCALPQLPVINSLLMY